VTVAVDEGGDIPVPDFSGKTMREVTETCLRLGWSRFWLAAGLQQIKRRRRGRRSGAARR